MVFLHLDSNNTSKHILSWLHPLSVSNVFLCFCLSSVLGRLDQTEACQFPLLVISSSCYATLWIGYNMRCMAQLHFFDLIWRNQMEDLKILVGDVPVTVCQTKLVSTSGYFKSMLLNFLDWIQHALHGTKVLLGPYLQQQNQRSEDFGGRYTSHNMPNQVGFYFWLFGIAAFQLCGLDTACSSWHKCTFWT